MIELLTANTPNGKKISIMLEEVKFKFKVTKININKEEQFKKMINPKKPKEIDFSDGSEDFPIQNLDQIMNRKENFNFHPLPFHVAIHIWRSRLHHPHAEGSFPV